MPIPAAYVAGFLDGEGSVTILRRNGRRSPSYGLHVAFTNCDLRPLRAIQLVYGGTIFAKPRRSLRHAPAFELRVGKRQDVQRLLTDVAPFMLVKREQVEVGLTFLALGRCRMIVVGHRRIHPIKGGTHPILKAAPGEQELRQDLKARLNGFNTRGQRACG